jgi:hypothetical protein
MNRALCTKEFYNSLSCRGLRCGDELPLQFQDGTCSCARSVPPEWRKVHSKLSDPQDIGRSSLPPNPLSLPLLSKPVAALSSSLKFFRFSREDGRKSSEVTFQKNGGHANQISVEGTELAASGDEEVDTCMEASKSVDMSNLLSIAVAEAESRGEAADDARVEVMRSAEQMSRPLIRNFAKLSSFWKKENSDPESSKSSETDSTSTTRSPIPIESCQFIPPSCGCQSCEACCSESGLNGANLQVTPHSEIARNKEYFGTFLYPVPSAERKRITRMAHLSNLAYRIPTIQVRSVFVFGPIPFCCPCCSTPMCKLLNLYSQM